MRNKEDFNTTLHRLKEPLDDFDREVEAVVATIPTPPFADFQRLVAQTRHRTRRRLAWADLLFLPVAVGFLGGVGLLIHQGYLLPVMTGYAFIGLGLPFIILWPPTAQKREVD